MGWLRLPLCPYKHPVLLLLLPLLLLPGGVLWAVSLCWSWQ